MRRPNANPLTLQAGALVLKLWCAQADRLGELAQEPGRMAQRHLDRRYSRLLRLFNRAVDRFDRRGGDRRDLDLP